MAIAHEAREAAGCARLVGSSVAQLAVYTRCEESEDRRIPMNEQKSSQATNDNLASSLS